MRIPAPGTGRDDGTATLGGVLVVGDEIGDGAAHRCCTGHQRGGRLQRLGMVGAGPHFAGDQPRLLVLQGGTSFDSELVGVDPAVAPVDDPDGERVDHREGRIRWGGP